MAKKVDLSVTPSIHGVKVFVDIHLEDEVGRHTVAVVPMWLQYNGIKERVDVSIADEDVRKKLRMWGGEYIFEYLRSIGKATYNAAAKIADERWPLFVKRTKAGK